MSLIENALADPKGFATVLTSGHMISMREDDKHTSFIGLTVNR